MLTLVRFIRAFRHGLKDAEFRALLLRSRRPARFRNDLLLDDRGLGTPRFPVLQRGHACNGRLWRPSPDYATVESFHHSLHSPRGRCLRSVHHQGDCPRDQARAG